MLRTTLPRPDGRLLQLYTWRHNNVLRAIGDGLRPHMRSTTLAIDLDNSYCTQFGSKLLHASAKTKTKLYRPDMVLTSRPNNSLVIAELTCPLPENMERWRRLKRKKYQPLIALAEDVGWCASLWTLEISSAGHVSADTLDFFRVYMPKSHAEALAEDCGAISRASTAIISGSYY